MQKYQELSNYMQKWNIFLCGYAYELSMLYTCAHTNTHLTVIFAVWPQAQKPVKRQKNKPFPKLLLQVVKESRAGEQMLFVVKML